MGKKHFVAAVALIALLLGFCLYPSAPENEEEEGPPGVITDSGPISSRNGTWKLGKWYIEENLSLVNITLTPEDCAVKSTRCPEMTPCRGALSKLSYCVDDKFMDPVEVIVQTLPHVVDGKPVSLSLGFPAFKGRLFRVDDVIVNHRGTIFNDKIMIYHGGCKSPNLLKYPARKVINSFYEGFVAVHDFSHNYYHLMGEVLPGIFQARQFILDHPHIPLVVKGGNKIEMILRVLRLENLVNVIYINKPGIIHLDHAYVPTKAGCFSASRSVWKEFRDFYFTHSVPEILGEKPRVADGLKIVVAKRNTTRAIDGFDVLIEKLRLKTKGELAIFTGEEGLDGTMEMFSNATIFVGPHGAGFTNMMFMPDNGVVLEILPDHYPNLCYGHMAAAIGLEYHMISGSGSREMPLFVDLDKVVDRVVELAARFH